MGTVGGMGIVSSLLAANKLAHGRLGPSHHTGSGQVNLSATQTWYTRVKAYETTGVSFYQP